MRRIIFVLCLLGSISCAANKWIDIGSEVNIEELMQNHFPRLYPSYKSNDIEVTKVEQRLKDSVLHYRVTYKDVYEDDSDEQLLWQCIYLPNLHSK